MVLKKVGKYTSVSEIERCDSQIIYRENKLNKTVVLAYQ